MGKILSFQDDKWSILEDELKNKIAQSNVMTVADFDLQVRSKNLIL
jgi:hypothetical protein